MEDVTMSKEEVQARVILLSEQIKELRRVGKQLNTFSAKNKVSISSDILSLSDAVFSDIKEATESFFIQSVAEKLKKIEAELNSYLVSKS